MNNINNNDLSQLTKKLFLGNKKLDVFLKK